MGIQNSTNNIINPRLINRVFGIKTRQAIAAGPLSSGLPNAITTTSGLNCQINASSTNAIACNFAAGFDSIGLPVDYGGLYTSNQSYSSLSANTTHYFYLERNTSTGALTPTRITIAPVYGRIAPAATTTGLHWFKTSEDSLSTQPGMQMYEWTGSVWTPRQRVFLGEVATNGSAVASIANYAYNGRYESSRIDFSGAQNLSFAHNLGMPLAEANAMMMTYGYIDAVSIDSVPISVGAPSTNYGVSANATGNRLNQVLATGALGAFYNGVWYTSGQIKVCVQRGW